jgi:cytochrome c biogenesis protein
VPGRNLERLGNQVTVPTSADPDAALAAVDRVLGRRRYRRRHVGPDDTASGRPQLAAERGHLREAGNLVFHSAFYVLLIGAVIGQGFGFTGQINVAEGGTFTDTRIVYGAINAGRWFGVEDHRGFQVQLDDFDATYHDNGTPDEFVSRVSITDDGEQVVSGQRVVVNHPLTYDGMKLYQLRFGMAPHVVVRAGDTVLFDDRVMLADAGGGVWTGAAKIKTSGDDQIALDIALLPDFAVDDQGRPVNRSQRAENPVLFADLWVGELGLDRPVAASEFIRDGEPVAGTTLAPGDASEPLVGNLTVAFPEMAMWSGFQVSHAPGRWLLLISAALLLTGLLASLYAYRRRVWAEVVVDDDGRTAVVLAGVALQRKVEFAAAFERLADDVRAALPPATGRDDMTRPTTDAHHG